ncbi:unnamed protein product [Euphydryas editha]|uniref:Uncharacterized protein n=1 Tax=Euphydryas editha TaxID=104508 RepID=A0AAU9TIM8_EUPED|nr:unnamed protein product [Euphydryas editha]
MPKPVAPEENPNGDDWTAVVRNKKKKAQSYASADEAPAPKKPRPHPPAKKKKARKPKLTASCSPAVLITLEEMYHHNEKVNEIAPQDYVYTGHTIRLGRKNFEKEADRRIQLGWEAFGRLRPKIRSLSEGSAILKDKSLEQCVLSVFDGTGTQV